MKGGKTQDAKIAIREELAVAVEGGDHIWAGMNDPQADKGQRRGFDVEDEAALIRVSEVGWLSRALIWVMRSSQDSRLHQHVLRCIKSIHSASLRNDLRPKTVIPSPLSPPLSYMEGYRWGHHQIRVFDHNDVHSPGTFRTTQAIRTTPLHHHFRTWRHCIQHVSPS